MEKCKNYECREYTKDVVDRCKLGGVDGLFERCAKKHDDPSQIKMIGKGIEKKRGA